MDQAAVLVSTAGGATTDFTLGTGGSAQIVDIIGLTDPDPVTSRYKTLIVNGTLSSPVVGPGKWDSIDGKVRIQQIAQSGTWASAAITHASVSDAIATTFTLNSHAGLTSNMVGWLLQPDQNQQVYVPITALNANSSTITVAGDYEALGAADTRFRIYAPPGTETFGDNAGLQSRWVGADGTRYLYCGYRFETTFAGRKSLTSSTATVVGRQTGGNYGGLYYTLHRHFDPVLMRWTSPDPAAQCFYNLFGYCGNAPGAGYDPDGDIFFLIPALMTAAIAGGAIYDGIANDGQTVKEVASRAWTGFRTVVQCPAQSFNHYARGDVEPDLTQGYRLMGRAYESRQQLLEAGGDSGWMAHVQAGLLAAGDVTGATGVSEFLTRTDSVSGARLSLQEANVRGILGASALGMSAIGGASGLSLSRAAATKFGLQITTGARALAAAAIQDIRFGFGGGRVAKRGTLNMFGGDPTPQVGFYSGGKTTGALYTAYGDTLLSSGYKGPSHSMPSGSPGMNWHVRSHVEAHASSLMHQQGVRVGVLYINRIPCGGVNGCNAMLPHMLPKGARLRIIGPGGYDTVFVGRGR